MPTNRALLAVPLGLALLLNLAPSLAQSPPPAQAPATPPVAEAAPPTPAEQKVDEAIIKVGALRSISADLRVDADMLSQKFSLKGQYLKAEGHRTNLQMTLSGLGSATGTTLQICDGVTLWNLSKVLNEQLIEKITIKKIVELLDTRGLDLEVKEALTSQLGFSGPETLLSGLRKSFEFTQIREADYEGKPVWILGGTWKDTTVPITPKGGTYMPGGPLPGYIPSLVTLYVGKEDGFPYKVELEGRKPAQVESKKQLVDSTNRLIDKKLVAPSSKPSQVVMIYSAVKINEPIADENFAFAPPAGAKFEDRTDLYVSSLEKFIADKAAKKRADAAKAGPVLDGGGLTAPSGDGPAAPK